MRRVNLFHLFLLGLAVSAAPAVWPKASLYQPPPNVPGPIQGEVHARWLSPYVSVMETRIGSTAWTKVSWLDSKSMITRELSGRNITARPGYIAAYRKGVTTIYGVNEDWKFGIRKERRGGVDGYINATPDSRTFVHQYDPRPGQLMLDVYKLGRLAATVGPFTAYKGKDFELGDDGSISLLCWDGPRRGAVQVVVIGSDGEIRFRSRCDPNDYRCWPAPGGRGVLVQKYLSNGGEAFVFHDGLTVSHALAVGPNPVVMSWLPGTTKALLSTSIGYQNHYQLIAWPEGKVLWNIPDPNTRRGPSYPETAWVRDYLLLSSVDFTNHPVRTVHAVNVASGEVAAHWLPSGLPFSQSQIRFGSHKGKLFYIADDLFTEVKPTDINAGANGWRAVTKSQ